MGDFGIKKRYIVKVKDPAHIKKKIHPEELCINRKTGCLDVAPEFFSKVWDEHQTDDTWNAWVCIEDDGKAKVVGFIVLQVFVHDSTYFAWGPPLNKRAAKPDPVTGAISNVGEISCFCAQGCGALLLDEALSWAANNTNYHYVVLNSTEGAANWYRSHGFEDVKAYRLPPPFSQYAHARHYREHLYRHRLGDDMIDITVDEPSRMLVVDLDQFKSKRQGEESEREDDDDDNDPTSHNYKLRTLTITR